MKILIDVHEVNGYPEVGARFSVENHDDRSEWVVVIGTQSHGGEITVSLSDLRIALEALNLSKGETKL